MDSQVIEQLREAFAARTAADRKLSEAVRGMTQAVEQAPHVARIPSAPELSSVLEKFYSTKETCKGFGRHLPLDAAAHA